MSIIRTDSQQTTVNASVMVNGERRQAASATCSIRPGRSMTISVDMTDDGVELQASDLADVANLFAGYIADEIKKAAGLGVPVKLPGAEAAMDGPETEA